MAKYSKIFLPCFLLILLIVIFVSCSLFEKKSDETTIVKQDSAPPVNPGLTSYKEVCGKCHIPYPPHFLPSGSWDKILVSTQKHFGENLDIDPKTKNLIASYLKENGAERSDDKISLKIMQSLEGKTPLRLTEVPFIQKMHRRYTPIVLKKRSIPFLGKCQACHTSAAKWKF